MRFATGFAALATVAAASLIPASLAHAAPAPAAFAQCAVCHNAAKGAPNKIGPNLWGTYGTIAGQGSFAYTAALKKTNLKLDDAGLNRWLAAPMTVAPGTAMAFMGIKDAATRAAVIAYLKTLH